MPGNLEPPSQSPEVKLAIRAWNMCGGMDWAAIPHVAEILGYDDIEMLVYQLAAIRDNKTEE